MNKLRAAVIGVGYLGRFHAQKYKALASELPVELVGVCDSNFEQAKKIGAEMGVPAYRNARDLIGQIDVATIATVTAQHEEVATTMIEGGIHVQVEKPMTVTVEGARALVALAKSKNLRLCVGHSERFNPAYLKAKELIRKPVMIELLRHATYKARGADVSVVHDLMVHDLDLLIELSEHNSEPQKLTMTGADGGRVLSPTVDWAKTSFRFGDRGQASISVSRVSPQMTRSLRMVDSTSCVVADLQTGEVHWARPGANGELSTETFEAGKGDNLLAETRAFLKSVLNETSFPVTGEQGLAVMEWVHQVVSEIKES